MYYTVKELANAAANDPKIADQIKIDPGGALQKLAAGPPLNDLFGYRTVIVAMAVTLITVAIGGVAGAHLSDAAVALGSGALGALAGILAPSPVR